MITTSTNSAVLVVCLKARAQNTRTDLSKSTNINKGHVLLALMLAKVSQDDRRFGD